MDPCGIKNEDKPWALIVRDQYPFLENHVAVAVAK